MASSRLLTYTALLLAMAFWGMTFVWVKIVLEAFQPVTILLIRLSLSSLMLWSFVLIFKKIRRVTPGDMKLFAFSALFQPFIYFIGETYGVSYVSSTMGAIMISTIPVFMPLGSWIAFREPLGAKNLAGFIFAFAGVILMVTGEQKTGATSLNGILFLALAVMAAVVNTILVKRLTMKYNPVMIVTLQNTFGLIYFIPLFFLLDWPVSDTMTTDWRIWRNLIALAVFGSTFAFIFFTYSIRQLGINRTGIYSNLIPVFTALFAFLFLHEAFPPLKIAGMTVVIAGIAVVSMRKTGKPS
jgi:drug/metabolite transporter (DMT)-like permease